MKHLARKRFGQHFLKDRHIIAAIIDAIDPQVGEALVEIGPGLGAMTNPLVERCGRLTVIELDRDLAEKLRSRPELNVVQADVLKVDFESLCDSMDDGSGATKLRVVGNLPYNISTPILFHLLNSVSDVQDQHFMLQKEVVERMAAAPGGKEYGRLSVMLQWRYHIESVLDVPPESFDPPPRVDSAVVRMIPLADKRVASIDSVLLGQAVSVAFSQRRKLLRNTLGQWLEQRGYGGNFDVQRRAEEVPVAQYLELVEELGRITTNDMKANEATT